MAIRPSSSKGWNSDLRFPKYDEWIASGDREGSVIWNKCSEARSVKSRPTAGGINATVTGGRMHYAAHVASSALGSQIYRTGSVRLLSGGNPGAVTRAFPINNARASVDHWPARGTLARGLSPGPRKLLNVVPALASLRGTSSRRAWWATASRPGDNTRSTDIAPESAFTCGRTSRGNRKSAGDRKSVV